MPSYSSWVKDKKLNKLMVVSGKEYVLRESTISFIISSLSEEPHIERYSAKDMPEPELWDKLTTDSLYEYRVFIVDDAHLLQDTSRLDLWLKDRAKSKYLYLVLVTDSADFLAETTPDKQSVALLSKGKGIVIKCDNLKENELISWVIDNSGLEEASARRVIKRADSNLSILADVCNKVGFLKPNAKDFALSEEALIALCPEYFTDFVQAILNQNHEKAILALKYIDISDYRRIIMLLSKKLDQLRLIREHSHRNISGKERFMVPDVPFVAVKELLPLIRYYDDKKQINCRQLLAIMDSYVKSGVSCGILESLLALW